MRLSLLFRTEGIHNCRVWKLGATLRSPHYFSNFLDNKLPIPYPKFRNRASGSSIDTKKNDNMLHCLSSTELWVVPESGPPLKLKRSQLQDCEAVWSKLSLCDIGKISKGPTLIKELLHSGKLCNACYYAQPGSNIIHHLKSFHKVSWVPESGILNGTIKNE
ncbi:hypothetical protein BDP27DRAFT_1367616 [Rhodocollybia butyracea]|uniref:Uncharacterized protein n=1 Tax=Rhodocollybia butyracea TaxID=206335 RepID=A0A9P5PEQ3_9AGAR|nr:hypothetical protein BDP27DRAFT_1367616 [Rhodocollybia butyracea]